MFCVSYYLLDLRVYIDESIISFTFSKAGLIEPITLAFVAAALDAQSWNVKLHDAAVISVRGVCMTKKKLREKIIETKNT